MSGPSDARVPEAARALKWTGLLEQLYAQSWNENLGRFRAPFAFRGLPDIDQSLTSSLSRLAGGHPDLPKIELAMRRLDVLAAGHPAGCATIPIWRAPSSFLPS